MDGSNSYIYDRRRVWHETCVGAWHRRRGVSDRNLAVLLSGVLASDMSFVRFDEEVL